MMQDDPKIAERRQGRQVKQAAETAAGLTIADRLTRRVKEKTVELRMAGADGDFVIVMRRPMRAEMEALQKSQVEIQDERTQEEANDRMCVMLESLCIDDSLDHEFWMAGNYDMVDLINIVDKLFESLVERVKEAQTFRNR